MSDKDAPRRVIVIRTGPNVEVHTELTALERLRELAFDGALPGTHTESWRYQPYVGWVRDETATPTDATSTAAGAGSPGKARGRERAHGG